MSKKKKAQKDPKLSEDMERFFQSDLAERAAARMSDSVCIALHVDDNDLYFARESGKNCLLFEPATRPDVHFWVPLSTMRQVLDISADRNTKLPTMGIAILQHILGPEENKKIKFRVDASFLSLWSKGYFSVLKAGGPEVASYLAQWGFNSFSKIKEILLKVRG